jgi:dTMP kinase
VRKVIVPALNEGQWVLSDRFLDSTTVYQGLGRRLPAEIVERVNAFAVGPHLPGLTLVLDLDPQETRRRLQARAKTGKLKFDRLEAEPADFHERVRQGYLALAHAHPDRVRLVPAAGPVDNVSEMVWREIATTFHL